MNETDKPGRPCCARGAPGGGDSGRTRTTVRPAELKGSLGARLSRIEGQTRGIRRMIEEDAYCDDVLAQISAARAALDKAALVVLEHHMKHCITDRVREGDEAVVDELMDTLSKFM